MNTRYTTNILLAAVGGFLLVASFAFSAIPFHWMMLGGGIAAVLIASAIAARSRGPLQRSLDLIVAAAGAWTIVASLVFAGTAMTWLGFASGGAFVVLALAGLTAYERSTERVVHSLEVKAEPSPRAQEAARAERGHTVAA